MKYVINPKYLKHKEALESIVDNFAISRQGTVLKQSRNTLKTFDLGRDIINIKSFKVPNIFNQIIYKYFRKSKAQRSFEHANKLLKLGIDTPQPIAYCHNSSSLLFGKSYYISRQLKYDLTYRELINDFNYQDYDNILRAFTRFTFSLHEKGIEFLDHSPGNTLINKKDSDYTFSLVDLNRMKFRKMNFNRRMKNFARLSKHKHMIEIMSHEYAICYDKPYEEVFASMWKEVQIFRNFKERKKSIKQKLR